MEQNEKKTNDSCDYFRSGGISVNNKVDEFADEIFYKISQTGVYKNYVAQQEIAKKDDGLKSKIQELRDLNLRLQNTSDSEQAFREQEYLENRYSELCEDERVYMYIQAENEFALAIQQVYQRILDKIPFIE